MNWIKCYVNSISLKKKSSSFLLYLRKKIFWQLAFAGVYLFYFHFDCVPSQFCPSTFLDTRSWLNIREGDVLVLNSHSYVNDKLMSLPPDYLFCSYCILFYLLFCANSLFSWLQLSNKFWNYSTNTFIVISSQVCNLKTKKFFASSVV